MNNESFNTGQFQTLALIAATAVFVYVCYLFALPLLPALALALALANIALPLHRLIEKRIRSANLAAFLSVFLVIVVFVTPVFFVGRQIVSEIGRSAAGFRQEIESGAWEDRLKQYPRFDAAFDSLAAELNLSDGLLYLAQQIPNFISGFLVGSGQTIAQFIIAFFFLFFFFRDRKELLQGTRKLFPLTEGEAHRIINHVNDMLHASIKSLLIVAFAQGTLAGLMFWILGLPAPAMWGFVMSVFALMPFFGTWIIWIPAAIFLALSGNWVKALILIGWGITAVSTIDNLLYPKLVGDRVSFHPLLIFIAFVGGISVFGAAGMILGPVTLAVTSALLDIWRERAINETTEAES